MRLISIFILLTSFLLHTQTLCCQFIWFAASKYVAVVISFFYGLLFLLYPVCGWVADVCVSSFKMIKVSLFFVLFSSVMVFVSGICGVFLPGKALYLFLGLLLAFGFGMVGLGMYEANAIQFGMDQMFEASSEQLSSFIHWYFWYAHVGPLLMFYALIVVIFSFDCAVELKSFSNGAQFYLSLILGVWSLVSIIFSLSNLCLCFVHRNSFHFVEIKRNSLKAIFEVLKYAYHHKYPERRSAFTYWENDVPSRIDLGKEKYGGPFTYEQVEDVKTMFRLLLLMVSLFGFHISGDGYSLSNYVMNTMGCPSLAPFVVLLMNPQHIPFLMVSLSIPVYQLTKSYLHRFTPSLLTRMKVGLFVCLINEALLSAYTLVIPENSFDCSSLPVRPHFYQHPLVVQCLASNLKVTNNGSCEPTCTSAPSTHPVVYLAFVPFVLEGIKYLFVFLTMFEFICAQSPNTMRGLLIGLWYSMLVIKYSMINVLESLFQRVEISTYNLYHGVKGLLVFTSLILFMVIRNHYHYRERNEVVNEQTIIEEIYERELLMNSER